MSLRPTMCQHCKGTVDTTSCRPAELGGFKVYRQCGCGQSWERFYIPPESSLADKYRITDDHDSTV